MDLLHLFRRSRLRPEGASATGSARLQQTRHFLLLGFVVIGLLICSVLYSVFQAAHTIDQTILLEERGRGLAAIERAIREGQALDSSFATTLEREVGLDRARFQSSDLPLASGDVTLDLPAPAGEVLAWTPRRLGSQALQLYAPLRIATSLLFISFVVFMLRRLYLIAVELDLRRNKAHEEARRDTLTGLGNRLLLDENLAGLHVGSRSYGILCIDLDGFKAVNDTFGHGAGDELLQLVARLLVLQCRPGDIVTRMGGDEFCVLRFGMTTRLEMAQLAASIEQALRAPFRLGALEVTIAASTGIAVAPEDGPLPEDVFRRADAALYRMKNEHFAKGLPPLRAAG